MIALVKAELRKLFTTRTWIWLLLGTVLLAMIQSTITLAFAGTTDERTGMVIFPPIDSPAIQTMALAGPAAATIFIAILGVIGVTAEYRHRTMTPTFLATPARWKVTVAKLITYLIVGIAMAAATAIFVVLEVMLWVNLAGGSFSLGGDNLKVLVGSAIASGLYGIIGVGFGALVRNQIGAVSALLAYMFVVEGILSAIPATQGVFKFLPGGASAALYTYAQPGGASARELLEPVVGGLILAGYAVVLAVIAYALTTRREVNN